MHLKSAEYVYASHFSNKYNFHHTPHNLTTAILYSKIQVHNYLNTNRIKTTQKEYQFLISQEGVLA